MDFHTKPPATKHHHCSGPSGTQSSQAEPSQAEQRAVEGSLHREIEALIPRLRRYAGVLTRDSVAADDLVQDCLARALGKIHLWQQGTDLRAWLFTILHHQHLSLARRDARQHASIQLQKCNAGSALSPTQAARLELRDLDRALAKLPEEQRSVILLVGLEGMRYEEAASVVNLPVGTVRSRVSRGRETLRMMTGLFPSRHSRRPINAAKLGSRRRQALHGNHFESRSPQMLQ
jgi:RNA polymerase sigma-70 factor, ECF subfamily